MESVLPIPADEAPLLAALADPRRLAAVHDTSLLDTPPEESFDRLTRLAARLTGAPMSFISLLDAGRDFYKSAYGLDEPLRLLVLDVDHFKRGAVTGAPGPRGQVAQRARPAPLDFRPPRSRPGPARAAARS